MKTVKSQTCDINHEPDKNIRFVKLIKKPAYECKHNTTDIYIQFIHEYSIV